jgi:hypothetical protein
MVWRGKNGEEVEMNLQALEIVWARGGLVDVTQKSSGFLGHTGTSESQLTTRIVGIWTCDLAWQNLGVCICKVVIETAPTDRVL